MYNIGDIVEIKVFGRLTWGEVVGFAYGFDYYLIRPDGWATTITRRAETIFGIKESAFSMHDLIHILQLEDNYVSGS